MPNINFDNVEESTGGFERIEPGAYKITFVDATDEAERQYVSLVLDIAEGKQKGFYGKDSFYDGKPYAHRLIMSYKPKALGITKHRLNIIGACNPGFDALAAFNNPAQFMGKTAYVAVGDEEYRANNGDVRTRTDWMHAKLLTPEQYAKGDYKVPDTIPLKDEGTGSTDSDSAYSADIPF